MWNCKCEVYFVRVHVFAWENTKAGVPPPLLISMNKLCYIYNKILYLKWPATYQLNTELYKWYRKNTVACVCFRDCLGREKFSPMYGLYPDVPKHHIWQVSLQLILPLTPRTPDPSWQSPQVQLRLELWEMQYIVLASSLKVLVCQPPSSVSLLGMRVHSQRYGLCFPSWPKEHN